LPPAEGNKRGETGGLVRTTLLLTRQKTLTAIMQITETGKAEGRGHIEERQLGGGAGGEG